MAGYDELKAGAGDARAERLNSQLEAEEKNIEAACLSIGKQYIELHPDNYEDVFAAQMAQISGSKEKISRLKWQLQVLNGITVCIRCGKEVPAGSAFCNHCGIKLPVIEDLISEETANPEEPSAPPAESLDDIVISDIVPEEPKTVPEQPVIDAVPNVAPEEHAAPVDVVPAPEPTTSVCPVCGEALEPGARFCISCGTAIANQPTPKIEEPKERICPYCGERLDPRAMFCTECGKKLFAFR